MQSWLYDISERITALQDVLLTAEDESMEADVKAAIIGLYANDVPAAVSDGIGYIKSQEAEMDAIDAEIKRLQAIKRARENRLERVRKGYTDFLSAVGQKKIETPRGCMAISAPTYTTVIDDAAALPQMYTRQTIKVEPEKGRIKQAIQAGENVPGAHLEARQSIRIK